MSDLPDLPNRPPTYKTIDKFAVPQGLYRLRSGTLNNQLQRLYSGFMNGRYTRNQVNTRGIRYIQNMSVTLRRDVGRWLRKFKQGTIDPDTWDDIDKWTQEKIDEWENIVSDM